MHRRRYALIVSSISMCAVAAAPLDAAEVLVHRGTCDASAAVPVRDGLMLVANDEDNVLRLYRREVGGMPVAEFDLTEFLDVEANDPEADIEAATTLADFHIWITSHGRGKDGDEKPSRRRLFATQLTIDEGRIAVRGAGRPYKTLVEDLSRAEALRKYGFASAAQIAATKPGGLNIEGLAAMPDGRLLVGLRGPLVEGRAVLVPIENPASLLEGAPVRFGEPIELDLGGLAIRGMEYVPAVGGLLIAAGPLDESRRFRLYVHSGNRDEPARGVDTSLPSDFSPEALVVGDTPTDSVRILSDDGSVIVGGESCKSLDDAKLRSFSQSSYSA